VIDRAVTAAALRKLGGEVVRHEAAVAAARDADALRIDVRVFRERRVDAAEIVLLIDFAPFAARRPLIRVAVAGRPARIGVEDEEAGRREDLELIEPAGAVRAVRSAVDLENHRVLLAGDVAERLHHPAVDRRAVLDLPVQTLRLPPCGGIL
jgi:hypothetical protein